MHSTRYPITIVGLFCALGGIPGHGAVQFDRDIQPILSDHCYACHGPDANQRKAQFRLDQKESAFSERDGVRAIVPGDPDNSELVARIETTDTDDLMPPPNANLALTPREKTLLRQWIAEGGSWEEHWAFIPPQRPAIPPLSSDHSAANPIDHFVLKGLENNEGLHPQKEASPERLLRRVTVDLTGLVPSLEEMDRFLSDPSPHRYERVVDRLLASQAYAERMALEWMDVARYADSHGMHADGWRMMWPWRDWVIDSFQSNQPYDEFVTWQLAGDLLPNPSDDQIIATAFHRNHAMTAEGGIVDEEFRVQYVFDRAQTTATAFLGLTLECARCHDHKFDPLSQKEYYQMTAFFNNLKELGMTGDDGNYGPMHLLATEQQKKAMAKLDQSIQREQKHLARLLAESPSLVSDKTILPPAPVAAFPFDAIETSGEEEKKHLDGNTKTSLSGSPELVKGRIGNALLFNGEYDIVSLAETGLFDSSDAFTASAWIHPESDGKPQTIMGNAGGKNNFWRGWDLFLDEENHLAVKLIHALPHSYLHVRSAEVVPTGTWTQIALTYDGSSQANGLSLFLDGVSTKIEVVYDHLYKSIYPVSGSADRKREDRALRVGKSYRSFTGEYGIYHGMIDEIRLWNQPLTAAEIAGQFNQDAPPADGRAKARATAEQITRHLIHRTDRSHAIGRAKLASLYQARQSLIDAIPEIMVMEETSPPRPTFILQRGQYDAPTLEVGPDTPKAVLQFPEGAPRNRLGLARWLFEPGNPLTARVAVNRYWQLFFGKGLVETAEDFGKQGARPTHPNLLDWLAVEFRESGWNLRHLHKLIVMSGTYRQSSNVKERIRALDPRNERLARGPRHRLPAELIRDQALAASGLLVPTVGGPSVKPFQPEGLWIDKGNFSAKLLHYKPDQGEKLYRKSLYTFIRRTSPHPAMVAFDAPNRDVCQVRRERTNTPLQALVLMNDPQFVEAARVFAERIQKEAGADPVDQIRFAFRVVTSRFPNPTEINILAELLGEEASRFNANPEAAQSLLETGSHPVDPELDRVKTASLAVLANTLLNHDELYTKR